MEPRTKRVVISITPTEKKLLSDLAAYEGRLSLTATVRHILMEAVRMRGLDRTKRSVSNTTSIYNNGTRKEVEEIDTLSEQ